MVPPRGHLPSRGAHARGRVVGRTRRSSRASTSWARNASWTRPSRPCRTATTVSCQHLRGLRRRARGGPAAGRDLPRRAREPLLHEQGRGRARGARGGSASWTARGHRAAVQPPRAGSVADLRGAGSGDPPARRARARRPTRSRWATSRRDATSATCATSCARIGCSPSTVSRARSTTWRRDTTWRSWTSRRISSSGSRPACELVVDPALLRPVEVPVSRGSHRKAARRDGMVAADRVADVAR